MNREFILYEPMVHDGPQDDPKLRSPEAEADGADEAEWTTLEPYIVALEQEGRVTRTFVRLDARRQRAIIDGILDEATENGPAAVNIKKIAARAGVAVGSLYQYFPDREGLLDFAVELSVRYTLDFLSGAGPFLAAMPLREALHSYLATGVEWGRTQAGMVRFLGKAAYQGDRVLEDRAVKPIAAAMRALTHDIVVQAAERGELRPGLDVEAAARIVNVLALSIGDSQLLPYLNTYFQVTDASMTPDRIAAAFVEFAVQAITRRE